MEIIKIMIGGGMGSFDRQIGFFTIVPNNSFDSYLQNKNFNTISRLEKFFERHLYGWHVDKREFSQKMMCSAIDTSRASLNRALKKLINSNVIKKNRISGSRNFTYSFLSQQPIYCAANAERVNYNTATHRKSHMAESHTLKRQIEAMPQRTESITSDSLKPLYHYTKEILNLSLPQISDNTTKQAAIMTPVVMQQKKPRENFLKASQKIEQVIAASSCVKHEEQLKPIPQTSFVAKQNESLIDARWRKVIESFPVLDRETIKYGKAYVESKGKDFCGNLIKKSAIALFESVDRSTLLRAIIEAKRKEQSNAHMRNLVERSRAEVERSTINRNWDRINENTISPNSDENKQELNFVNSPGYRSFLSKPKKASLKRGSCDYAAFQTRKEKLLSDYRAWCVQNE